MPAAVVSLSTTRRGTEPPSVDPAPAPRGTEPPSVDPAPAAPPPPVQPPPSVPPTLTLLWHDRQREEAEFRCGSGVYRVTVPPRPTSTLTVVVTGAGRSQSIACDLAEDAARRRNASVVAVNTGLSAAEVAAALAALLPAVLALIAPEPAHVAPLDPATVPMTAAERDAALATLTAPDLLRRCITDLGHLGADPDDPATAWAWLAAASRLGSRPLWLALTATLPGERFPAVDAVNAALPADAILPVGRLTDGGLAHLPEDGAAHRLLTTDAGMTDGAALALRVFRDRGVLTTTTVERTALRGGLQTRVATVRGPAALLITVMGAVPPSLAHHVLGVPVDDSPEAQARRRAAEVARLATPAAVVAAASRQAAAAERLRNLHRLLIPRPVAIPDLAAVALPAGLARTRLHHDALIGLIEASALLHQHQRPTVEGCVVATSADIDRAIALLHAVALRQSAGLSRAAHTILTALWAAKQTAFTMPDLHRLLGWERHIFRAALDELIRLDYIAAPRGVRGQFREYRLVTTAPAAADSAIVRMPRGTDVPTADPVEAAHG